MTSDAKPTTFSSSSRLSALLETFQSHLSRIDNLEKRVNERAIRLRRRMANLLDQQPRHAHRLSHLRLFVTHKVDNVLVQVPHDPRYQQEYMIQPPEPKVKQEYKLQIEGKLLVGHLDHASAAAYDKKTGYTPPNDDLDRSKGETEEEEVQAMQFTHFFDQIVVQFTPIFHPKPHPMSRKTPTPKKSSSRRGSAKSPTTSNALLQSQEEDLDPSVLVQGTPTELIWTRNMSSDAHAWSVRYTPPDPPGYHLMPHTIAAKIRLFSHRPEDIFQASSELADALFPHHGPEDNDATTSNKKRKADEISTTEASTPPPPPLENEIHIPQGLTMKEIIMAFFTYIQDNRLTGDSDKSFIVCDKTLHSLFGIERFPFHQLQQYLFSRNLIRKITHDPIELVYVIRSRSADEPHVDDTMIAPMQLDMDIHVPALFPFRTRELLRRIKRRELEYTSSRTKARYILMSRRAKSEDAVKTLIDETVGGHSLREDLQPVMAALSKAALPNTEARMSAHLDMRMSYLLGRVAERQNAALSAWALADMTTGGRGQSKGNDNTS